jgi:MFS transporter, AAHS family, benzoate transport protein
VGAIVGPVITGALFAAGIAFPWGFYFFAVVGALGAASLAVAVTRPARS